jgi:hypothetical protein
MEVWGWVLAVIDMNSQMAHSGYSTTHQDQVVVNDGAFVREEMA